MLAVARKSSNSWPRQIPTQLRPWFLDHLAAKQQREFQFLISGFKAVPGGAFA